MLAQYIWEDNPLLRCSLNLLGTAWQPTERDAGERDGQRLLNHCDRAERLTISTNCPAGRTAVGVGSAGAKAR